MPAAGANVVMPNYTPLEYRVNYEIYPNKRCITEDPSECHGCMRARIESIGRVVAEGKGRSLKRNDQGPMVNDLREHGPSTINH